MFAHLQTAPTPDLSAESTTALMQLMLAQAQESFCIKACKGCSILAISISISRIYLSLYLSAILCLSISICLSIYYVYPTISLSLSLSYTHTHTHTLYVHTLTDRIKDLLIAKIAMQCSDLYAEAYSNMQVGTVKALWEKVHSLFNTTHIQMYVCIFATLRWHFPFCF